MSRTESSTTANNDTHIFSIKGSKKPETHASVTALSGNLGEKAQVRSFLGTAIGHLQENHRYQQTNSTFCSLVIDRNKKEVTVGDLSNNSKAYAIIATQSGKRILVSLSQNKDSAQIPQISTFTFDEIIDTVKKDEAFKDDELHMHSVFVASKGFSEKEGYFLKSNEQSPNLFDAIYRLKIEEGSRKIIQIKNNLDNPLLKKKLVEFEVLYNKYQGLLQNKDEIYQAAHLGTLTSNSDNDTSIAQVNLTQLNENPQTLLAVVHSEGPRSAEVSHEATSLINDGFKLNQIRPSSTASRRDSSAFAPLQAIRDFFSGLY